MGRDHGKFPPVLGAKKKSEVDGRNFLRSRLFFSVSGPTMVSEAARVL